jgi:hypothetical protein
VFDTLVARLPRFKRIASSLNLSLQPRHLGPESAPFSRVSGLRVIFGYHSARPSHLRQVKLVRSASRSNSFSPARSYISSNGLDARPSTV